MTNEELDRLEALCDAATDGPWVISEAADAFGLYAERERWIERIGYIGSEADAHFVITSREAVPALIAENEALRAELDAMRGVVEAVEAVEFMFQRDGECSIEHFDRKAMRFYRETGLWPPGKSMSDALNAEQADMKQFADWQGDKVAALRAALDALDALKAQQEQTND